MDGGAWQATVRGVPRMGHDLNHHWTLRNAEKRDEKQTCG